MTTSTPPSRRATARPSRRAARRLAGAAAVLVLVVGVGACSDDDDDSTVSAESSASVTTVVESTTTTPSTGTSTTGGISTTPTSTGECPPVSGVDANEKSGPAPAEGTSLLAGVTAVGDPCGDTVQFVFASPNAPPGFRASYQPGPFLEDPSGRPVDIAGDAFLVVRFEPAATADLTDPDVPITYTGPDVVTATGARFVTEVHKIGDFEGVVTWVIGVDTDRPFVATSVPGPANLTIAFPDGA